MKIFDANIPCSVFKAKVENHETLKKNLLKIFDNQTKFSIKNYGQEIYNTDYHIEHKFRELKYKELIFPVLSAYCENLKEKLRCSSFNIDGLWFHQYAKNGFHDWHTHGNCMFSNVYYVDLDTTNPQTTFRHLGQIFTIPVSEGEILTFPTFLQHCSQPNLSDNVKTVIAFNSNFL